MDKVAVRNLRLCTKDCLCLYVCPVGATDTENSIIDVDKCIGCGVCAGACPSSAISMVPKEYPAQQAKTDSVKAALHFVAGRKADEEKTALQIAEGTALDGLYRLMRAVAKSERLVAEDVMREAGYMLPQSNHAHELLEGLIAEPPAGFPVEAAKRLLHMVPNNEKNKKKEGKAMKKWVCSVCGYVHEGDSAPEKCPQCGVGAEKFTAQGDERSWAAEHVVGVAQGASEDIMTDLRANYNGECAEVGMYLAMARVAHREGYPEIGLYWEKAAWEEAEHAAKFAELLGEVVTDSTKKNLEMRVEAENGATAGKFDLAKRAKAANLDAIHDTVHEMARDEARHGKAFEGLLKRYFS